MRLWAVAALAVDVSAAGAAASAQVIIQNPAVAVPPRPAIVAPPDLAEDAYDQGRRDQARAEELRRRDEFREREADRAYEAGRRDERLDADRQRLDADRELAPPRRPPGY